MKRWFRQAGIALGTAGVLFFSASQSADALEASAFAQQFRAKWPWHLQTITYAFANDSGGIHILVSEPPDFMRPGSEQVASLSKVLETGVEIKWFKTRRGMNGWVQDLVISGTLPDCRKRSSTECKERLEDLVADLSSLVFGTAYKAHTVSLADLPNFDAFSAPKDLTIDVGGFSSLLGNRDGPVFKTWDGKVVGDWAKLISSDVEGTFYSSPAGLVAFAFSSEKPLGGQRGHFRQFALDSDILLGGSTASGRLGRIILLGRERETDLFKVPPLRFEDLDVAVRNRNTGQFQTFGNEIFQGARVCHGKYSGYSFFPAFLSGGLVDTRYGSTLNSADVLIKSYTEAGSFKAPGLDLTSPKQFPFREWDVFLASGGSLTYNWSLDRGVQIFETPQNRFVMPDHSNALSVSYFAEVGPDLSAYQVKSQDYFFKLRSLPVFEARQLTTLLAVLQNREPRSALKNAPTANRTMGAAEAFVDAVYRSIIEEPKFERKVREGTENYLKGFSERDAELLKKLRSRKTGSKDELLALEMQEKMQKAQNVADAIEATVKMSKLPRTRLLALLQAWHIEALKGEIPQFISPSDYILKKEPGRSFDYIERSLIDWAGLYITSSLMDICLIGDVERVMAGIGSSAAGNIKTTDYVLGTQDLVTFGGHNLHRNELVFQSSSSTTMSVRKDPGSGRYIVDVPENLVDKLDIPKVVSDLKRRDLRGANNPMSLPTPLRQTPKLASLTERTATSDVHLGASPEHVPANSLFSGFGWKSEVGRLSETEFQRQLQIAESRGFDLIVKSIGGDTVVYRKVPPGQFLMASHKALLETLSQWTTTKSNIYFVNVPKAKIDSILKSIPSKSQSELRVLEIEPLAGGGGRGNIVSRDVSFSPSGRDPLRIITYAESPENFPRRLLSPFLGRRPDWSKAEVKHVTSSVDEAIVRVENETYFELGWKVTLPEGRGERSYFQQTSTKLNELSSFLVKAFSRNKWTKASDVAGDRAIAQTLEKIGDEYRKGGSRTTEEVMAIVRDEMRASLKANGIGSEDKQIRFLVEELEATHEIGALEFSESVNAG